MSMAKEAFQFVTSTLPDLLTKWGEGNEVEALEELTELYRARRTAEMKDRRDEIERNRAEVDATIAKREKADAEAKKKRKAAEEKKAKAKNGDS